MDNTEVKLTDKDLNEILRSFDDDPNNELRTYTDSPYITLDSLVTLSSKKTDQFSILDLNIQSLNSKFDAFTALLSYLEQKCIGFSAICLQETWLSDNHDTTVFNIPGYHLVHSGKSSSECGGLIIYVSDTYSFSVKNVFRDSSLWEGLFIEVHGGPLESKLVIGNIYRPPKYNNNNATVENFAHKITPIISSIAKSSCNIVISGDFNIDLLQINERVKYQKYFDMFVTNGLFPLITLPTREGKHSATLIDQIFCKVKNFTDIDSSGILKSSLSDHYPCLASLDICKKKQHKPKYVTINNKNEQALISFCNEVETCLNEWQINRDLFANPNENYNIFDKIIMDAKAKYPFSKTVRFKKYKHKISPWMNHDILRSIKDRDDLYKTVMSTPSEDPNYDSLKENLQNLKSSLKKKMRCAKAKYYADVFEKNKSNIRHTWGAIKEILGKFKNKHDFPDHFTLDGKLISEPQLIANCFNRFFSSVGRALSVKISYNGTNSVSSYLKRHVSSCFHFEYVNPTIVMKYINDLASKSSCGPDKISSILLKRLANYIVTPLTVMINQSLCTGTFPDKLKLAKVIPLYKKGDNHVFDNYRPISLLSTVSKIFEKVVFIQVYDYFCAHQLFYENQYGFRKCHSTELAALELVDRLFKHLDDGKIPVSVFLDLSKAFDTLNHAILMDKLKYYGLNETSLNWFRSYLHDRYQYTEYNGTCSDVINLTTGVPQGSILGPLLFIIYMNDIHVATSNFKAILYADDTNLLSPMCSFSSSNSLNPTNLTEVTNSINDELSHVHEWLLINKLSVNVSKTKFMIFHHHQRRIDTLIPDLKLDSQPIEYVLEFNFLGLTLDEHLSWKPHVQKVANKTSRTIGILRRLKNIVPISVLRTLYNTLILPHFHYCILSWGFRMGRLKLLQKRAVRVMSGSRYNAHTDPLFKKLHLVKLSDLFTVNVYEIYYKLRHVSLPTYVANMFKDFLRNHEHEARQALILDEPNVNTSNGENCIRYLLPRIINKTNHTIVTMVDTYSYQGFVNFVKNDMIGHYIANCSISNCYICNHTHSEWLPLTYSEWVSFNKNKNIIK